MCGRFGLSSAPWDLADRLRAKIGDTNSFQPKYNIAPTQQIFAITNDDARSLVELRWGLVPPWAKSPADVKLSTFNARIETIATAPTYRGPTRSRRCIIAADGFYEWRKNPDGTKTPFWIHRSDRALFGFAGLWEIWRSEDQQLASCTIITAPANDFMHDTHSRMPIALDDARARRWLESGTMAPAQALELLVPQESAADWTMHPVAARVGNVRNDDSSLIESVPTPPLLRNPAIT